MKTTETVVRGCMDCPLRGRDFHYYCHLTDKKILSNENDKFILPKWCPLRKGPLIIQLTEVKTP